MQAKYHLSPCIFTLKASFIQSYYSLFHSYSFSHTIPCLTNKVSTTDLLKRLTLFTLNIITFTNIYFHPKNLTLVLNRAQTRQLLKAQLIDSAAVYKHNITAVMLYIHQQFQSKC